MTSCQGIVLLRCRRWQLRPALCPGGTELPAVRGTPSHFAGDFHSLGQRLLVCRSLSRPRRLAGQLNQSRHGRTSLSRRVEGCSAVSSAVLRQPRDLRLSRLKHLLARGILLVSFLFAEQFFRYGSQEPQLSATSHCAALSTIHMRHRIGVYLMALSIKFINARLSNLRSPRTRSSEGKSHWRVRFSGRARISASSRSSRTSEVRSTVSCSSARRRLSARERNRSPSMICDSSKHCLIMLAQSWRWSELAFRSFSADSASARMRASGVLSS